MFLKKTNMQHGCWLRSVTNPNSPAKNGLLGMKPEKLIFFPFLFLFYLPLSLFLSFLLFSLSLLFLYFLFLLLLLSAFSAFLGALLPVSAFFPLFLCLF